MRIEFWTSTPTGQEKQHYTVRLTNATLSTINFKMANIKNPKLQRLSEYEELSFTYQKIEWTWNEGGLTAADDWETPR
ncbi:MAG: type VI secretion system tube protein Hcp [Minicystis sp.]